MKKPCTFAICLGLLAATATLTAQTKQTKDPVHVACANDNGDTVGSRICTAIRDRFAASPRYSLTDSDTVWNVHIVSVSGTDGVNSALSWVLTLGGKKDSFDYYVTGGVQLCGTTKVDSCASNILSGVDAAVVQIKETFNSLHP